MPPHKKNKPKATLPNFHHFAQTVPAGVYDQGQSRLPWNVICVQHQENAASRCRVEKKRSLKIMSILKGLIVGVAALGI